MRHNELEVRLVGVMRSGSHTVMEWILSLYPREKVCFLDNVVHGNNDPYTSARSVLHMGFDDDAPIEDVRAADKRLLIYSYEDRANLQKADTGFIDSVFDPEFEASREQFIGTSQKQFNIIVLRDPFSCFASRLMQIRERSAMGGTHDLRVITENWKALAKRALSENKQDNDLVILYNRWTCDAAYRKKLAANLSGQYSEINFKAVLDFSRGRCDSGRDSWFRRTLKNMQRKFSRLVAWVTRSKMPMMDNDISFQRWHILRGDPLFRELFTDPEILALSEKLFGDIPGARRFVNSVNKRPFGQEIGRSVTASPEV